MNNSDSIISGILGTEVPRANHANEPPPGFFDDGPDSPSDAAEPTNGVSGVHAKRPTLAEQDRARIVWGDALDVEDPIVPRLCDGLAFATGRPSVICGEGGSKKSFLAQYFALCVATGKKFLGRHEVQRGKTLFIDYEAGLKLYKKRARRFAKGYGFSLSEFKENIAYIERPFFLDDVERGAQRLAELVRGFTLVIVDSAFRSAPRLRQNDAEAATPFEIMTRASNWTGAVLIAVDHASTKRDKDASRKSMQSGNHHKLDGAGSVYMLTGEKGKPTLVTCEREQDEGEYTPDFAFDVVDELDPDCVFRPEPYTREERKWGLRIKEFPVASTEPDRKPPANDGGEALYQIAFRILEEVKKQPGVSSGELLEKIKIRPQRFNVARDMLVRDGKMLNRTGKKTLTEWVAV